MVRQGLMGPIFSFECLTAARRWRLFAGRGVFVLLLLAGLGFCWMPAEGQALSTAAASRIGNQFFTAVVSVQLAVVLLAAPAAAAGAICIDKGRGTLHHAFVTDLTAREIVLGKLGARLVSVLGLMACGLPVLALSGLLGGVEPRAAVGAYLVAFGVAVVGTALALTFSVWARKPHQALLPTYAILGVWIGVMPLLVWLDLIGNPIGWTPALWVAVLSNPIGCTLASSFDPTANALPAQAAFLGGSLLFGLALALLASGSVRSVTLEQASRPARRQRPGLPARLLALVPGPPLDGNAVLWREWHRKRPSRWTGRLWTAYALVSGLASLGVIVLYYLTPHHHDVSELAGLVNGGGVTVGLLLLSITAPLALAEERDRGSLDVIMATPLSSATIVWGKWWGTFAIVPRLAIFPIWVAAALTMVSGHWTALLVMIGMIFAPAAALTSLGLALATWVRRTSRAIACSMAGFALMTVGGSVLLAVLESRRPSQARFYPFSSSLNSRAWGWDTLELANPYFGVSRATIDTGRLWNGFYYGDKIEFQAFWGDPRYQGFDVAPGWALVAIGAHLAVAAVLMALTLLTFDRCMGRVPADSQIGPDDVWTELKTVTGRLASQRLNLRSRPTEESRKPSP